MVNCAGRGLEAWIERAQRLQVVTEELGAHRLLRVGRPYVQHAAAHGKFALGGHLGHAIVSGGDQILEQLRERLVVAADGQSEGGGRDGRGGRHGIAEGGKRRDDRERIRARHVGVDRGDCLQPGGRRGAVVLERWGELEDADAALLFERMEVRRQSVGFWQSGRDGEDERHPVLAGAFGRERDCGECGSRAGERRQGKTWRRMIRHHAERRRKPCQPIVHVQ